MKKVKNLVKKVVEKYGHLIATCAFAFVVISANSGCVYPYHEPEEPAGLDRFKKFNK